MLIFRQILVRRASLLPSTTCCVPSSPPYRQTTVHSPPHLSSSGILSIQVSTSQTRQIFTSHPGQTSLSQARQISTSHASQISLSPDQIFFSQARQISTSRATLAKKGVMARFKQMVKDYWYIIVPVEFGTSVIWYGAIFISLKSGVDLGDVLTSVGVSDETVGKLPSAGGDTGYHALAFICYKVISPIRHTLSLAISAAIVSWLSKTRPGYMRTSSSIAKDARDTSEDMVEKYEEKKAEGKEKMNELRCRAKETGEDMRGRYEEKVAEGKDKIDEYKTKADEKGSEARKNLGEKMENWRNRK